MFCCTVKSRRSFIDSKREVFLGGFVHRFVFVATTSVYSNSACSSLLRSFFVSFLFPPVRANSSRSMRASFLASCGLIVEERG